MSSSCAGPGLAITAYRAGVLPLGRYDDRVRAVRHRRRPCVGALIGAQDEPRKETGECRKLEEPATRRLAALQRRGCEDGGAARQQLEAKHSGLVAGGKEYVKHIKIRGFHKMSFTRWKIRHNWKHSVSLARNRMPLALAQKTKFAWVQFRRPNSIARRSRSTRQRRVRG